MNTKNSATALMAPACPNKVEWAFLDAMQAVYGPLDLTPLADDSIHRFHVPGDRSGTLNGWYVLFTDGIASGCFGSWKQSGSHTWSSRKPVDPVESQLMAQRIEQARQKRQHEQLRRQQATALKAQHLWKRSEPATPDHPYLVAKGCYPHNLRRYRGLLLVPLYCSGQLANLQCISPDGSKRFLSGGRVKGCYSLIGDIEEGSMLYVCEGWATGATIHEETSHPVTCAMNAGNLLTVARDMHQRYPNTELIVAGDDDRLTKGNPGRTAATDAALSASALVIFPDWPDGAPASLTDFNDLRQWRVCHG